MFDLKKLAKERWYNLIINFVIYDIHGENIFKSRKTNISVKKQLEIIINVTTNCYEHKKSTTKVAREIKV